MSTLINLVPDESKQADLAQQSTRLLDDLFAAGIGSPEYKTKVKALTLIGREEAASAASISQQILNRPAVRGEEEASTSKATNGLGELTVLITELDDARPDLTGVKRGLRFLPNSGRRKIEAYLARFTSAQTQLDTIDQSLTESQEAMRNDTMALQIERQSLWDQSVALVEVRHYLTAIKEEAQSRAEQLRADGDEESAQALEAQVVAAVNRRDLDLTTQMAVNAHGYELFDLVLRNYEELDDGIERARTVNLPALRQAVIAELAMHNSEGAQTKLTALKAQSEKSIQQNAARLAESTRKTQDMQSGTMMDTDVLVQATTQVKKAIAQMEAAKIETNGKIEAKVRELESTMGKAN